MVGFTGPTQEEARPLSLVPGDTLATRIVKGETGYGSKLQAFLVKAVQGGEIDTYEAVAIARAVRDTADIRIKSRQEVDRVMKIGSLYINVLREMV